MHRVIGEGSLDDTLVPPEQARAFYRDMVRARRFDERALALQRRGWMSGYPPFRGQEASQVGAAHATSEEDWLFPTYRSNALQLARGVAPADLLRFRRGGPEFDGASGGGGDPGSVEGGDDEAADTDAEDAADSDDAGGDRSHGTDPRDGRNVFPQAVPIATQIPHAAGAGMARNYRGNDEAMLVCFGDGATSEGDFHEGLNFAGVFDAPTVFFCENNGWAISLPRERQTASETIAGKARAYGFEGVRVDGNDPLAVYETVCDALESARAGDPVLVESLTYRRGAHTTADDPDRYRDAEPDLPEWRTRDPVERYEAFLREEGVLDDGVAERVREEADEELSAAVEAVEAEPPADPDDVFEHVFADLPPGLRDQRAAMRESVVRHDPQRVEWEREKLEREHDGDRD